MIAGSKTETLPCDGVPGDIGEVEDEVFGLVILRPAKHLGPVFEIRPGFLGGATAERGETSQEFEQDAAEGPVVDSIGVGFATEDFRSHVIGRTDDRIGIAWVFVAYGTVYGTTLDGGPMDDFVILYSVQLRNEK